MCVSQKGTTKAYLRVRHLQALQTGDQLKSSDGYSLRTPDCDYCSLGLLLYIQSRAQSTEKVFSNDPTHRYTQRE